MRRSRSVAEVAREPVFALDEIERACARARSMSSRSRTRARERSPAWSPSGSPMAPAPTAIPRAARPEPLPRIARDDLVAAQRRAFRPDNAVLILAGDITPEAGLALARRHFGSWAAPAEPVPAPAVAAPARSGPTVAIVDMAKSGQAGVVVALPLPERSGSERSIGAVLNSVLGGGYSSRLNQEVRIKRGLSYGAGKASSRRGARRLLAHWRRRPQERVGGRGRGPGAGGDRSAHEGADSRRRARRSQADPHRRLQPQRRDNRRARHRDPHPGRGEPRCPPS